MYSVVILAASDRHCSDKWNWSLLQRTWRYIDVLIRIDVFLLHFRYYLWNVVCTLFTSPFLFVQKIALCVILNAVYINIDIQGATRKFLDELFYKSTVRYI